MSAKYQMILLRCLPILIKQKLIFSKGLDSQVLLELSMVHTSKLKALAVQMQKSTATGKVFFSINVQAVCDANLNFIDAVVRWPGSTHDSRIFENSNIFTRFDNGQISGLLLGDSGYPLKTFCITPYANPEKIVQRRFNKRHSQTRMSIEKAFGVLKRRFPALKHGLRFRDPQNNCYLILSAMVLHNICNDLNDEDDWVDEQQAEINLNQEAQNDDNDARMLRDYICENYFQ